MNGSKLKLELRIDWSEIDVLGHINNLAILKYIQAGRVNYLESVGLLPLKPEINTGPIIASTTCQFRKPLFYPGNVTVYSKVDLIKNTSFRIQYEVLNDDAEIVAEAHDIIVFYDFDKNTKLELPEELKKKITSRA
ncbi:MAG TPA: acyl-CoA thioesterase [Bacteroidales bacterium]|nr:acyl-CoA thioesterase [Bacteroidales bacterium]